MSTSRDIDFLVLDGIPRNVGQARLLDEHVDVQHVFHLSCPNRDELARRMRKRALKDNRMDDANEAVIEQRFVTYEAETKPILAHYSSDLVTDINATEVADPGAHRDDRSDRENARVYPAKRAGFLTECIMRLIFSATGEIALPAFRHLLEHGPRPLALVTQRDKPVGRKQVMTPPAIKSVALEAGIPVYQPEKAESAVEELAAMEPEVVVVMAYGQILREKFLKLADKAIINLHASLLPKYRGAACIQAAIDAGDSETGVTSLHVVRKLDAGRCDSEKGFVDRSGGHGRSDPRPPGGPRHGGAGGDACATCRWDCAACGAVGRGVRVMFPNWNVPTD